MKSAPYQKSELNPPYNITPSVETTLSGIFFFMPLTLLLVALELPPSCPISVIKPRVFSGSAV
jgi:hypothetical protein